MLGYASLVHGLNSVSAGKRASFVACRFPRCSSENIRLVQAALPSLLGSVSKYIFFLVVVVRGFVKFG